MLSMKYIGTNKQYDVNFDRNGDIVTLLGKFPVKNGGFTLSRPGKKDDWDYSEFNTVYREIEGGAQFSNNGEVYVEPTRNVAIAVRFEDSSNADEIRPEEVVIKVKKGEEEIDVTFNEEAWEVDYEEVPESEVVELVEVPDFEGYDKKIVGLIVYYSHYVAPKPYVPTEEELTEQLEKKKEEKIAESKAKLAEYLAANPLFSTCHNPDGEYYNVTSEKQSLMTSNYLSYQIAKEAGVPAQLAWNSTGSECEPWTEEQFVQLILEAANYVHPLVTKQQSYEIAIKNAETEEELNSIFISYGFNFIPSEDGVIEEKSETDEIVEETVETDTESEVDVEEEGGNE